MENKIKFATVKNGYEKEKVDLYIAALTKEYLELKDEFEEIKSQKEAEDGLPSHAEELAKKIINKAKEEADRMIEDSKKELIVIESYKEQLVDEIKEFLKKVNQLII